MAAKNLIIGFGTNQSYGSVAIFCNSALAVAGDRCDVVIVTNQPGEGFERLSRSGVLFVPTVSEFKPLRSGRARTLRKATIALARRFRGSGLSGFLLGSDDQLYRSVFEQWHHPHYARWIAYERFLDINRAYDQVFISDVRDVAFQADPFAGGRAAAEVQLFQELEPFGDVTTAAANTNWYRDAYGARALDAVRGRLPVCIGTILGPHAQVLSLVREISAHFLAHPFGAVEQAIFNHMLAEGLVRTPHRLVPNMTGAVATLSSQAARDMASIEGGRLHRPGDGAVFPAVHLYDRFADTEHLFDRYLQADGADRAQASSGTSQ